MRGVRIGRLFGIDVLVDTSWVLIFVLMSWNLTALMQQWHPEWGASLCVAVGVAASLAFFGSVLLHELGHALVAKAHHIPVRSITLFLFGGVSSLEREPESPRAELLIAIVGPLVSIALGFAVIVVAAVLVGRAPADVDDGVNVMARLGPIATLLVWLGPVNVTVGLFNLIPGLPLDGGRILRAGLWAATGDLRKATRWSGGVGQLLGWTLVAAGIAMVFGGRVPFFGTGLIGGMWLAFIGYVLASAAARAYSSLLVRDLLEDVTAGSIVRPRGQSLAPDVALDVVARDVFLRGDDRCYPVMEHASDVLLGLVCIEDLRRVPQTEWAMTPVSRAMTPRDRLVVAEPSTSAVAVLAKLAEADVSQLPVIDGRDRFLGFVLRRDLARRIELGLCVPPYPAWSKG